MPFRVKAMDHIVLTVRNVNATVGFYTERLGMRHEVFKSVKDGPGIERHALVFGNQKINLHQSGSEFEPKAKSVQPGSGDLCFLTDTPIQKVLEELKVAGLLLEEDGKVVERTGAKGKMNSVYTRDPDGNLIEVSNYVD